jgi:HlyD family secretion protein
MKNNPRKTFTIILLTVVILAISAYILGQVGVRALAQNQLQTVPVQRGDLSVTVSASGTVRSNQSVILGWQTTGTIGEVDVKVGDLVTTGQLLASLEPTSLSQAVISARISLIGAQKNLDDLLHSKIQAAQAQQAFEDAQHALEDARDPDLTRANALQALAEAEKNVENARTQLAIVQKQAPQSAIDQAQANLLLAKNVLDQTKASVTRIQNRLNRPSSTYLFFESKEFYRRILENLNLKLLGDQRSYDEALEKYNSLLEPPDPNDLLVAEANLAKTQAEFAKAQLDWERIKDGPNQADIAVLEAQLEDAAREWARLEDGPDPADLAAAQARVDSAQAVLNLASLTAPFSGTVTELLGKPGDQVAPGVLMIRLDDLTRLNVDINVSEIDINNIQVGMPVQLTFDAVPDSIRAINGSTVQPETYQGRVTEVRGYGQESQEGVVYRTSVEIANPDEFIKPGISADADLVLRELKDVLLIPSSAIRFSAGQRIVYLMRDEQPTPIPVQVGASAGSKSELLAGNLAEGDQILVDPPAGLPEYQPPDSNNP